MDVFGNGDIRPLDPPGVCFICETSPQQESTLVVNTNRHFHTNGPTHLSGRKYVCGPCVEEMASNLGMVTAERYADLAEKSKTLNGRTNELEIRVTDLENFHELASRLIPPVKKKPAAVGSKV